MLEANTNATKNEVSPIGKDPNFFSETGSIVAEKSAEARSKGLELLDNTLSKAKAARTSAIENGKQLVRTTDGYVKKNPWRAVTASAALGLMLGLLFKRRN